MLSLFIGLSFAGVVFADQALVSAPSGRNIVIEQEVAPHTQEWLVVLPGSSPHLYHSDHSRWVTTIREARPMNLLVVNKAGIDLGNRVDYAEFNQGSLRERRIADTIDIIKTLVPADAKITMLAESEGGYLAPDVALNIPQVKTLILMSAGTQSWIDEEIMMAPEWKREEVRQLMRNVVAGSSEFDQFYGPWSYAQLSSFDTQQTKSALLNLKIPVYAFNGTEDRMIWLDGNLRDFREIVQLNQNVRHHLIVGADHGLSPAEDQICSELLSAI